MELTSLQRLENLPEAVARLSSSSGFRPWSDTANIIPEYQHLIGKVDFLINAEGLRFAFLDYDD